MAACPCSACGCSIDSLLSFSSSPPVAELLKSNEPPSDTERVAISDENEQLKSQIAELNNCISRTEASLKQLLTAKDALQVQLAKQANILSPIRTLPTDILCEIFTRCAEGPGEMYASTENVPWLLAAVSRRWRMTAIAFSQLWSHIAIELDFDYTGEDREARQRYDQCYSRLLLQVQRSRQYPLSLYLMSQSQSLEDFPDILRVLSETSHCWKHLSLDGPLPLFQSLFAQELPLPLLQAIDMDMEDAPVSAELISSSVFRNASSLTQLTVPVDVLLQFEWPLSQITACTISSVDCAIPNSRACSIIRQFHRLQALSYRMDTFQRHEPCESPVTLSSLTKLTLDLSSLSSGDQLIEALVLPNLTHLWLKGTFSSITVDWILSLHARSNFNLSSLAFDPDAEGIKQDIVFRLLEAFPRIYELSFGSRNRYLGKILMRLALETTMAPNLKVLKARVTSPEKYIPRLANSRPDLRVHYIAD